MNIGVYADPHVTKNMRVLQDKWEDSVRKSIHHMYNHFDELSVESVVCLGDFFDAPRIEAKNMNLVLPLLEEINSKSYPTYFLLGNHEMDSEESNILEYLNMYDNIIPVTEPKLYDQLFFIPYGISPTLLAYPNDSIVFTHHDIYGSELAAGKTKAFFGVDTSIFRECKLVINGHVHLKSRVSYNIMNAGSLLVSQQGELRIGEYPSYYVVDTETTEIREFENRYSMIYLTVDERELEKLSSANSFYDLDKLILKIEYEGEIPSINIEPVQLSWKKKLSSLEDKETPMIHNSNFDMKNYLIEYINKDQLVSDSMKDNYTRTGLELLS